VGYLLFYQRFHDDASIRQPYSVLGDVHYILFCKSLELLAYVILRPPEITGYRSDRTTRLVTTGYLPHNLHQG